MTRRANAPKEVTAVLTADELFFFREKPSMLPVYEKLREALSRSYADLSVRVSKTQISFRNRYSFAMVSFQRVPKCPKRFLLVSFGLGYEKVSPRIAVATEAARDRWTHHVAVQSGEEIDGELLGWLEEAYGFSNTK